MKLKRGDQRRLAAAIGRKPSTVCDYLKGRARPSYEAACRLAAETGTHVLFWLDREGYDEQGKPRSPTAARGGSSDWIPPEIPSWVHLSEHSFTCVSCGAVHEGPHDARRTGPDCPSVLFIQMHQKCGPPWSEAREQEQATTAEC